jgi:transposase
MGPLLPNKPSAACGRSTVLNGIFWALRSGAPWRDLPESFGPYTTCYNRLFAGEWDRILDALGTANVAAVQMIDTFTNPYLYKPLLVIVKQTAVPLEYGPRLCVAASARL